MTLRVAQLGCGYWGPNLVRNLLDIESAELVAVAEASPERRAFVVERFPSVKVVSDHDSVISDGDVDAVVIATPAATHFALAFEALRAGKHVLVEKPLAMSVADCDRLGEAAAGSGRTVMVGHTFLYNPAVIALQRLVESGTLGDVHHIYAQRLNLGQVRSDVNALWNLAPHDFSIVLALMGGMPASVAARGVASVQPGIEDVVFVTLEWPNGRVAHVHVSWLDPTKVRRMTVVGTKSMVIYDDMAKAPLALFDRGIDQVPHVGERMDFDSSSTPQFVYRQGDVSYPAVDEIEPLRAELEHFVACTGSGAEPISGLANARAVVGLLEAAQASLTYDGRPFPVASHSSGRLDS